VSRSLLAPGGFVATASVASRLDHIEDAACAFCFGDPAWYHVLSERFVCRGCMGGDPNADGGERGRRVAKRLLRIKEPNEEPSGEVEDERVY